jgi:hypothetical protein
MLRMPLLHDDAVADCEALEVFADLQRALIGASSARYELADLCLQKHDCGTSLAVMPATDS